jgi:DNA-binding XRE family transcriptional regulator
MKARNFKELQAAMSPERRARNAAAAEQMLREMPLDELRAARQMTQESLASVLGVKQASISKLERRADMYVSTLARFIEAMGGKLEIRACFPEGSVCIKQFSREG